MAQANILSTSQSVSVILLCSNQQPRARSRAGPKSHPAEDHRKDSKSKKRSHTATNNREPIQDKLFTIIANKAITMIKIKGVRALDELAAGRTKQGHNPIALESGREKVQQRKARWSSACGDFGIDNSLLLLKRR